MSSLPLLLLLLSPLLPLLAYTLYTLYLSPLSSIPGPLPARLTRLWLTRLSWLGGTHTVIPALHARYGPLVRIAPSEISVSDPKAIKTIYGHGTKFRKSEWYSVWQGRRKFDLFPERDEKVHGRQRSLVSRPYSMASLKDLEVYVDGAIGRFVERMEDVRIAGDEVFTEKVGDKAGVIDIGRWLQLFAFDVIGEITFSKRFGFLDSGPYPHPKEFTQIEAALRSASWIGQVPWLYWLHDYVSPYIGNKLGITARHGSLRNFAVREVTARKDRGSDHQDILGKLLAVHREKPDELPMEDVMSMVSSNIFAGSDTTAVSTRAVVYYLLKNPVFKDRLVAEIDGRRRDGRLSPIVQLAEAEQMPFLQAVIWESLRMHPAVGMSLPRVVPDGGLTVGDTFIPAGTVVGTNPWVIHRDTTVFGPDADRFNPDRWIERSPEQRADMRRCFFTFGAGARVCLGQNIGWMEMSKLIPTLFGRYDVKLARDEWTMTSWWFVMQKGVEVTLTPR